MLAGHGSSVLHTNYYLSAVLTITSKQAIRTSPPQMPLKITITALKQWITREGAGQKMWEKVIPCLKVALEGMEAGERNAIDGGTVVVVRDMHTSKSTNKNHITARAFSMSGSFAGTFHFVPPGEGDFLAAARDSKTLRWHGIAISSIGEPTLVFVKDGTPAGGRLSIWREEAVFDQ
ncbi:hypothetical protein CPC08DRAFT_768618 [Agrocybe pediades]|nr:hypothetical protein CPC08DRAFT_768618 [Agrocybe pediades]